MKPLYWKFLLIVGAMIVGASLVVPKALRKNAAHNVSNTAQTVFLTVLNPTKSTGIASSQNEDAVTVVDKVKAHPAIHNTRIASLGFVIAIRFIAEVEAPMHSLNAGTRPTKSRVID